MRAAGAAALLRGSASRWLQVKLTLCGSGAQAMQVLRLLLVLATAPLVARVLSRSLSTSHTGK